MLIYSIPLQRRCGSFINLADVTGHFRAGSFPTTVSIGF